MDKAPSEEELRAFVQSMLSNLDRLLREPEVIDDAIRQHRDLWERLYRVSLGFSEAAEGGGRSIGGRRPPESPLQE